MSSPSNLRSPLGLGRSCRVSGVKISNSVFGDDKAVMLLANRHLTVSTFGCLTSFQKFFFFPLLNSPRGLTNPGTREAGYVERGTVNPLFFFFLSTVRNTQPIACSRNSCISFYTKRDGAGSVRKCAGHGSALRPAQSASTLRLSLFLDDDRHRPLDFNLRARLRSFPPPVREEFRFYACKPYSNFNEISTSVFHCRAFRPLWEQQETPQQQCRLWEEVVSTSALRAGHRPAVPDPSASGVQHHHLEAADAGSLQSHRR